MADDVNINIGINPTTAETGAKKAVKAVNTVSQSSKDLEASFRRIKTALDPTWQAQQKYNQALADVVKLQKADRLSKDEATAARKAAKAAYDAETASITRRIAAAQALASADKAAASESAAAARKRSQEEVAAARLATQEKINLARQERAEKQKLFQQEQAQIKLAAQLARQAALDAARANKPISQRAIGPVEPGSRNSDASIKQLEYRIQQAMGKLSRLTEEAEAAAVRAAGAASTEIAQRAQQTATARAASAQETRDRILEMERDLSSQIGALEAEEAAQAKAANEARKTSAKDAADAAAKGARDTAAAKKAELQAIRDAQKATEDEAKAIARQAQELQEFRAQLNPAYAAQLRYNETMQRATALLMQNKLAEGEWIAIQRQANIQMDINTRQMGRANQVGIQLGYQVQDVAASLASGIKPLVIFAQQSGQFAYALQMAGGRAAQFASILGGVWVQGALAAVIVLSQLWGKVDEGKTKTIDLQNAEQRRTATVQELTKALKEYTEAQQKSNNTLLEGLRITDAVNFTEAGKLSTQLAKAKEELEQAKRNRDATPTTGGGVAGTGGAARAQADTEVAKAQEKVDDLIKAVGAATNALTESRVALGKATGTMTAEDILYNKNQQKIIDTYRKSSQSLLEYMTYLKQLRAEEDRHKAAKAAESQDRKILNNVQDEDFRNPLDSMTVTSPFGMRNGKLHAGVDLRAAVGTPVYAPQGGVVDKKTGLNLDPKGYGNLITLDFGAGTKALFGHLSKILVKPGQAVNMGDLIGYTGGTKGATGAGDSQAPHLHYEVRRDNKPVNPLLSRYPTDGSATGAAALKAADEAAKQLARDLSAAIDVKEELIKEDDSKPLEAQLSEITKLEDARIEIMRNAFHEGSKEFEEAQRHKLKVVDQINQQIVQREMARIKQELSLQETAAKSRQDVENEKQGGKADIVDYKASTGIITARQAVIEKARLLDEEYQMQQRHEREMYELKKNALMAELALDNLKPEEKLKINNELKQIEAEYLGQDETAQAQYARRVADINRQQAEAAMAGWKEITSQLSSTLASTFQGLWTRSTTLAQALLNMADQMVFRLVDIGLRAGQQQLENWIRVHILKQRMDDAEVLHKQVNEAAKTAIVLSGTGVQTGAHVAAGGTEMAIHAATTASKVASEAIQTGAAVTGATTQTAVAAVAGTTEIGTNAAVAAAGAYKSTVVIPFIGPVAAPVAAGLALAAVLGFASLISARGGQGEVSDDGQLSVLHKKEMVLPEKFAVPLRRQLTARSSSGMIGSAAFLGTSVRESSTLNQGGPTFNYQPQHKNMGASLDTLLREDGRTMRRWLQNEWRNGRFKGQSA